MKTRRPKAKIAGHASKHGKTNGVTKMYLIGKSTPERAIFFVSRRTHKNLKNRWGKHAEGHSVWWHSGKSAYYVGCFVNAKLIKP